MVLRIHKFTIFIRSENFDAVKVCYKSTKEHFEIVIKSFFIPILLLTILKENYFTTKIKTILKDNDSITIFSDFQLFMVRLNIAVHGTLVWSYLK